MQKKKKKKYGTPPYFKAQTLGLKVCAPMKYEQDETPCFGTLTQTLTDQKK